MSVSYSDTQASSSTETVENHSNSEQPIEATDPDGPDTAEPSDEYASTPEVDPSPVTLKSAFIRWDENDEDEDEDGEVDVDKEAYNELTKVDINWHTQFWPSDVREGRWEADYLKLDKERYFRMLGRIHRGEQNGPKYENSKFSTYQQRKHLVEMFGDHLNMTDLQIERAIARAANQDGQYFGENLELMVFCVCAYVVDKDDDAVYSRNYHPNRKDNDDIFERVAEKYDLSQRRIDSVFRRFEQEFSDAVPPRGFDRQKPGWEPGESHVEICRSTGESESVGQGPVCWKGGI